MNFPTMTYQADLTNDPNSPFMPAPTWTDLSNRVLTSDDGGGGGWSLRRGRSYSGGHADAGELDIWLDNRDGALTGAKLMAKFQILAGYGTNLLDRSTALLTEDTLDWTAGANTTVSHDLTRGFGAPGCLALTAVAGGSVSATMTVGVAVTAATAYRGWLAALAAATGRTVSATVAWFTAGGAANGTATQTVGVDGTIWMQSGAINFGTAPASTATAKLTVTVAGCAAGETHCFDLLGLFPGATVTAWTPPAAESPFTQYTGYVSQWAQLRDLDGVFPYVQPVVLDALSPLAGMDLLAAYDSEVLLDGPLAYYPCSEPAGSTVAGNISGYALPNATLVTSKFGGTIAGGDTSTPQAMAWEESPPASVKVTAAGTGATGAASGGCLRMPDVVNAVTPAALTIEFTARLDSSYSGGTNAKLFRHVYQGLDLALVLASTSGVSLTVASYPSGGSAFTAATGGNVIGDGKWHHYAFSIGFDGRTVTLYLDGTQIATATAGSAIAWPAGALMGFGGSPWSNNPGSGYTGAFRSCAVYQQPLDPTRIASHALVFGSGASGDTSDARLGRILNYVPWYGGRALNAGATSEGAALGLSGKNAVAALQDVGDIDENGVVFADSAGNVAFRGRHYAQTFTVPRFIFGGDDTAGEIPYRGTLADGTDLEQTYNIAPVTQQGGVQVVGQNPTSQDRYFPRSTGEVTVNTTSADEVADRANWMVSENAYGEPLQRVTHLEFRPSHLRPAMVPLAWYAALSLEVGDPVRVMIRDPGQPARALDCVVDELTPTVGETPGEWRVELSLSPLIRVWTLAAAHTTVKTAAIAGATSLVINPLADAATNPVEASLTPGGLVTVQDPGQVETVGVLSVASNAPGAAGYSQITLGVRKIVTTTTLTQAVGVDNTGSNATTLVLAVSANINTAFVLCEGEIMAVTGGAGTNHVTVTRGPLNGTSQAPHAAGATVTCLSAAGLTFAHAAGAAVSEQLSTTPDGRTVGNPARWDANSVVGVWATLVNGGGAAGTNSVNLLALPDWPVNLPAASVTQGMQLRLSPDTAANETLTVDTVSAPAADGSFTVTFTANLAHTHALGDWVTEPLPSGVNNPTGVVATTLVGY